MHYGFRVALSSRPSHVYTIYIYNTYSYVIKITIHNIYYKEIFGGACLEHPKQRADPRTRHWWFVSMTSQRVLNINIINRPLCVDSLSSEGLRSCFPTLTNQMPMYKPILHWVCVYIYIKYIYNMPYKYRHTKSMYRQRG